jgi:hypothetical protein
VQQSPTAGENNGPSERNVKLPNDSAVKLSAEPKSHGCKVNWSLHGDLDGRFR